MKIAHVTATLDREGAGVRAVVQALSAAQTTLGHEVRVLGISTPEWQKGDHDIWHGAAVTALAPSGPRSLGFMPELATHLTDFDPDIVHLHGLWLLSGHTTMSWCQKHDTPFLVSIHGMLSAPALRVSAARKRMAWHVYQKRILQSAMALLASSPVESDEIQAAGITNPNITTIPNGVDIPTVSPRPDTPLTVLSLGRLDPIKGLDHLLTAWAELEPRFKNWHLKIAGPSTDGYEAVLQSRIDDLGLKRARLHGPVYGVERDQIMADADIFVLPSLSENFALTVAECLAAATPVVVSHGAPWGGVVSKGCGRWVEIGAKPLRDGLADLMSRSHVERAEMGKAGRRWMEHDFAWPAIAERLVDVYRSQPFAKQYAR